jgi:hypothetical protein
MILRGRPHVGEPLGCPNSQVLAPAGLRVHMFESGRPASVIYRFQAVKLPIIDTGETP